jgi:hypothetical protein
MFVLIAEFRYGTPVRDQPQLSYSEFEHETAERRGVPRLVFLLGEDTWARGAVRGSEYGGRGRRSAVTVRGHTLVHSVKRASLTGTATSACG